MVIYKIESGGSRDLKYSNDSKIEAINMCGTDMVSVQITHANSPPVGDSTKIPDKSLRIVLKKEDAQEFARMLSGVLE